KSTKLGVEFSYAGSRVLGVGGTTGVGSTSFPDTSDTAGQGFRFTTSSGNLSAILTALQTDDRFSVLSTPRIFTSNNVQAEINISQQVPYVVNQRADANGNILFTYDFQEVGIILTVTPRITSNGYVSMEITQTANELQGYTSFNAPIVNQREANTQVSVKDGETIILGGIIRNTVTSSVRKVPILGDIPILGNLFKSTSKGTAKTELLVFLTPRIVRDEDDARMLREGGVKQLSPAVQKDIQKAIPPGSGPQVLPPGDPKTPDPKKPGN
ncbi:type II and III secretion system protein, partial [bacterium]